MARKKGQDSDSSTLFFTKEMPASQKQAPLSYLLYSKQFHVTYHRAELWLRNSHSLRDRGSSIIS
ncbi:MAG: hypothetical protein LUH58_05705 [Lachnospiraceae bacterium]|nr:hypothetical protein [Lachnospiraceae bacterium]